MGYTVFEGAAGAAPVSNKMGQKLSFYLEAFPLTNDLEDLNKRSVYWRSRAVQNKNSRLKLRDRTKL